MHDAFRRRLEALEETRKLQRQAEMHIISVMCEGLESTYAEGPRGFICHRRADEELIDFEDRAELECRAYIPHPQVPPILLFL
jgi:hypothetical protein